MKIEVYNVRDKGRARRRLASSSWGPPWHCFVFDLLLFRYSIHEPMQHRFEALFAKYYAYS